MSSTFAELAELYARWRELSEGESEAIHLEAWERLARCQSAKARLQSSVLDTSSRWQLEFALNPDRLRREYRQIQALIRELIELEKKNEELLTLGMARIDEQRQTLGRSSRNVSQIHRSYVRTTEPKWISYS